jgi:hypothetical protein
MRYEVRAYKTRNDFDSFLPTVIIDDLYSEEDALHEGRLWLSDHEIVKVQSDDREFIQVMSATRN